MCFNAPACGDGVCLKDALCKKCVCKTYTYTTGDKGCECQ